MSRFLDFLFSTTGALVGLFISAVWIAARPRSTAARRFVLSVGTFYLLASMYAVPAAVSRLLTIGYQRLERIDESPHKAALVLLGAGDEVVFGWDDRISVPNAVAGARVLEAWRVYRLLNPQWVISSGGNVGSEDASEPSSTNMRDLLVRLGVPHDRIVLESESRTTRDEAVLIAPMLRSLGAERIVLVTSAVHMRRSVGAFRAVGVNPLPAIAPDPKHRAPWSDWLRPGNDGLKLSAQVVHEVVGIPYYWVRGWWR
jgi:uncharacterized SAM-binding protein YcdF (DUF218 family)